MPPDATSTDQSQQDGGAGDSPAPAPGTGTPGQAGADNWEARYNGAMRVLSARDQQLKDLQGKADASAATVQTLQAQLETLQAESAAKVNGLTTQLQTVTGEKDTLAKTATATQAQLAKYQALKEFPDLLPIADQIPDIPDAATLKEHLKLLQQGVDKVATAKAERLTAGMVPGPTTPAKETFAYSTQAEWDSAMFKAAGTDQMEKVAAAYERWVATNKR
jgi:hypothetical protein